jgi:hypothetical protein
MHPARAAHLLMAGFITWPFEEAFLNELAKEPGLYISLS